MTDRSNGIDPLTGEATVRTPAAKRTGDEVLAAGMVVGDFEIIKLVGQGGLSRVYLAKELSLDRHVALKVSRGKQQEGRALAKLEHPNIVSVYREQEIDDRYCLAMRFIVGKTLAQWLNARGSVDARKWRGADLLGWLLVDQPIAEPRAESTPDSAQTFAKLRFVPAACQIMIDAARALQHAHQQGVLHLDVKPANIMLDLRGSALLMDFNVATQSGSEATASRRSPLGGTLPYMAPELLQTLLPEIDDGNGADPRSDIYALGIVFFELLAGSYPWSIVTSHADQLPKLRQMLAQRLQAPPVIPHHLAGVSAALRSILARCLAPQPADRYQDAAELTEDLQRYLSNRPPKFAADPSLSERFARTWRRQRRVIVGGVTIACGVLSFTAWLDVRGLHRAEQLLNETVASSQILPPLDVSSRIVQVQGLLAQKHVVVPHSLTARRVAGLRAQLDSLSRDFARAEALRFQQEADSHRAAKLADDIPWEADPLAVYEVLERSDWASLPRFRALELADRMRISEDIAELLLIRADTYNTPPHLLDRLPVNHQELPMVHLFREHFVAHALPELSVDMLAQKADNEFELYLCGVIAAKRGQYESAKELLEATLEARPDNPRFWGRFVHAYCCERLGHSDNAIADYGICIGQRPESAWPHHNLGLIYTREGDYDSAVAEFRIALQRSPNLAPAHANLGVALFQRGDFDEAVAELDRALGFGYRTAQVYTNRASAREATGDDTSAREDLQQALSLDPQFAPALESLRRINGTPASD
jgi:serine/threonine protein kinase/Flp pilus assembly protein TadD